jgi:predicted metalloprotease with PDZ domain
MDDRKSRHLVGRRQLLLGAAVLTISAASPAASSRRQKLAARYSIKALTLNPPRFSVIADLPIDGDGISVSDSYPAELPQMAAGGWPSLISGLTASDVAGRPVGLSHVGSGGWRLSRPVTGRIRVAYVVDFGIFANAKWPSPLESAVADNDHVAVCARPMFLTTENITGADVSFDLPRGWRPVAPWPGSTAQRGAFQAASKLDLTDNFIAFSTRPPEFATAAGFKLQIVAMGHWKPLSSLIRRALQGIVSREVALMGYTARDTYNVILVPTQDTGGEAYRQSFLYEFENPSRDNLPTWANTMAHEIFHYWNYARLQGADYASTQWFQEGFTEYVANLTLVKAGIVTPDAFLEKLSNHVANYRRLTTTLEAIGTHKGPPLYSAGALVAFSFDVMIRKASFGSRDIGTFFRNLWRYTKGGERKYAWADIAAALKGAAPLDWQAFYAKHIRGNEPLPLDGVFRDAGLKLVTSKNGIPTVSRDPSGRAPEVALWRQLVSPM